MTLTTAAIQSRERKLEVDTVSTTEMPFLFSLDAETLRCTNGGGTLFWDVERHVSGTKPALHALGTTVVEAHEVSIPGAAAASQAIDFSGLVPGAETTGSIISTGTTWVSFTTAGACGIKLLLQNDSATGEFATLRMRARANKATASGDGGNSIGTTTAGDFSASAQHADYGVLKAINAVAQPNALAQTTDATNIVTAVYGRIDATAASVGRRWVGWFDTHATTRADGSDHLVRLSHNGTAAIDGVFTIYSGGRMAALFTFEDISGFLSASSSGSLTKTHKIAVEIAGVGTRYIEVGTIA
jgi:hypothetical protein